MGKVGRNDPCTCGSGNKFKFCCATLPSRPSSTTQDADTFIKRGDSLAASGNTDAALSCYRDALALKTNLAGAHFGVGLIFLQMGKLESAVASLKACILCNGKNAEAYNNLGIALAQLGNLSEAVDNFKSAIRCNPAFADAYYNLGNSLVYQSRVEEAAAVFKKAHSLKKSDSTYLSNYLMTLLYTHIDDDQLFREHVRWHELYGRGTPSDGSRGWSNVPDPERKLRIGFVSGDLSRHPVGSFLYPYLRDHDRSKFEIFCYSNRAQFSEDDMSVQLRECSDGWRRVSGVSDVKLAEMIKTDGIDILIDLSGHSNANRVGVFAAKPAPLQMTWLGYPHSSGLSTIDFRITDGIADPAGAAEKVHSEELVRLENIFLCFAPHPDTPDPAELPVATDGTVSFGSFNNLAKIGPQVIEVWGEIMRRVPNSRLFIKYKGFFDILTRQRFLSTFSEQGISADRLHLSHSISSFREHMLLYNSIDVALDPFPYNGTATTCDALWMGVPVVTLCGSRHAARVGASILSSIGLDDLIAHSTDDYIETAVKLATDVPYLRDLRVGMRQRMMNSPLCDSSGFARNIEAAFRRVWRNWCVKQTTQTSTVTMG